MAGSRVIGECWPASRVSHWIGVVRLDVSPLASWGRHGGPLTLLTAVRDVVHSAAAVLARAVSQPRTPIV